MSCTGKIEAFAGISKFWLPVTLSPRNTPGANLLYIRAHSTTVQCFRSTNTHHTNKTKHNRNSALNRTAPRHCRVPERPIPPEAHHPGRPPPRNTPGANLLYIRAPSSTVQCFRNTNTHNTIKTKTSKIRPRTAPHPGTVECLEAHPPQSPSPQGSHPLNPPTVAKNATRALQGVPWSPSLPRGFTCFYNGLNKSEARGLLFTPVPFCLVCVWREVSGSRV